MCVRSNHGLWHRFGKPQAEHLEARSKTIWQRSRMPSLRCQMDTVRLHFREPTEVIPEDIPISLLLYWIRFSTLVVVTNMIWI